MQLVLDDLIDQARGLWRFRWVAIGIAWGVALIGWAVVMLLPDTYQASARVFVDTRTAISEVTEGITIGSNVDSQIQRVRQALLGGPQLERVAQETKLLVGAIGPRQRQRIIDELREDIDIDTSAAGEASVYSISYRNRDRETALRVVDRLLNTFVEGTLGGKREGSEQAQEFLQTQLKELEARLSAAEQRLADFKKRNVGLMPGTQGDYFTRLQAEMDALQKAQTQATVANRRLQELDRQLHGEPPLLTAPATPMPNAPQGVVNDTATRIRETRQRLDELLLRFTEKHPDVIALRQTLKELEQRQADEIAAAQRGDPGAAARTGLSANPVYQALQLQYNQAAVELAAIKADIADRQRKIAKLRSMVNTAPEVEAEYARLNRDYDVTRAQYQALLERLEKSRLGEEAEETGVIRFEVVDPPFAAFTPVAPKRPLLIIAVLVLALGAGAGTAYLLHVLKPVFNSARQLNVLTGMPVLGAVSMIWIERYRAHQRRDAVVYVLVAGILVVTAAVALVLQSRVSHLLKGLLV